MAESDYVAIVARVLRDTEHLRLVLAVTTSAHHPALCALIVHVNDARDIEEAAILLLHRPSAPILAAAVPLHANFGFDVEQLQPDPSEKGTAPILVHFKADNSQSEPDCSFVATSLDDLRDLFAETRRLHKLAEQNDLRAGATSHAWLAFYGVPKQPKSTKGALSPTLSLAHASLISSSPHSATDALKSAIPSVTAAPALAVQSIRDTWIVRQMSKRISEFTQTSALRLFIGTYNVAETIAAEPLDAWLVDAAKADIVVIGLQEVDMRPQTLISGRVSAERETAWTKATADGLGANGGTNLVKLASHSLGTVAIFVYVRDNLLESCTASTATVGTGPGGMASKGAAAVRLRCHDSVFTFVNAHLSAFERQVERRNQDLDEICRRLSFPFFADIEALVPLLHSSHPARPIEQASIYASNALYIFGDLNYRLAMPGSEVKRLIAEEGWSALWSVDQLREQQRRRRALADFKEGELNFAPTYKYDTGTSMYDTSEKQRTPSWTDRILWLIKGEDEVHQLRYASHESLITSDHKPVSSVFEVKCLVIDNSKRSTVRLSVLKALDAFENEGALPSSQYCRQPPSQRTAMPNADVTPSNAIDFGTVRYGLPVRQTFEIRNTGQVIAQFRFMPKPQTNSTVKPWLWLSPISGLILPGDSETITCTLNIDNEAASHFNFSDDDISDIAILSIVGGRDAFMSLSAREYLPTCFCNPFEQLARLERPIREYSTEERALLMLRANEPPIEPPRELMRLTEWLTAHALEEDDLFLSPSDPTSVAAVRDALDTGGPFEATATAPSNTLEGDLQASLDLSDRRTLSTTDPSISSSTVNAVADCLLRFLDTLPSVIPAELYDAALFAGESSSVDEVYRVAAALSPLHAVVLTHCLAFLKTYLDRKDASERDALAEKLAVVWSSVLLQPPPTRRRQIEGEPRKRKAFLKLFLV